MLMSKKNNKGFSLVEVIVSMLVLSVVISSVLTAFSLSAKSNAKTKKIQAAESLMEDLMELAGAVKDSSQYADTCATVLSGTKSVPQPLSPTETVEISEISGVQKGSLLFNVEIIRDTKPSAYDDMNNTEVISFGETGSFSVLIDASREGNRFDPTNPADTENGYDNMARDNFITLHNSEVNQQNAVLTPGATPLVAKTDVEIEAMIDRDVVLETQVTASDKMQLVAYFMYNVPGESELLLPSGTERNLKLEFFRSAEYSKADDTTVGAEKINKVYVLFSPCAWENASLTDNVDVRIWDHSAVLGADVFLVHQEDSLETVNSTLVNLDWATRFDSSKNIKLSFGRKGEVAEIAPYRVDLYCPASIIRGGVLSTVTTHNGQMVPDSPEIRVQEITVKIKDADGNELASDSIACLQ